MLNNKRAIEKINKQKLYLHKLNIPDWSLAQEKRKQLKKEAGQLRLFSLT